MISSSRKRAAEAARKAEAARLEEETRLAAGAQRQVSAGPPPTPAAPLAWLEMCDADQSRHPVKITNLRIGRGKHNDLVLRNDSVSGNHCVIERNREGEWAITDLKSGNGVVLNGEAVQQSALREGDVIEIGEIKMRFLISG